MTKCFGWQWLPAQQPGLSSNASEPATLALMLDGLQGKNPLAGEKPVIIMDAGIANSDNITWLSERGYLYLVVSRERYVQDPRDQDKAWFKTGSQFLLLISVEEGLFVRNTGGFNFYFDTDAFTPFRRSQITQMPVSKSLFSLWRDAQRLTDLLSKRKSAVSSSTNKNTKPMPH